MKKITTITLAIIFCNILSAQPSGTLDSSFANNGVLITPDLVTPSNYEGIADVRQQADGKLVFGAVSGVNGNSNFYILRYNLNGTPDNTFGTNGIVQYDHSGNNDVLESIAIGSDGKIYAGGTIQNKFAIVCLNVDGTLNTAFGTGGVMQETTGSTGNKIIIQPDGKILICGQAGNFSDCGIARYNADGTKDTAFGTNGITITSILNNATDVFNDMVLQPDNKIVCCGYVYSTTHNDFVVVRYKPNGQLDSTFNGTGIKRFNPTGVYNAEFRGAGIDSNGKLYFCGSMNVSGHGLDYVLMRLKTDGVVDSTFGTNGMVTHDFGTNQNEYAQALIVQSDDKVIVCGSGVLPGQPSAITDVGVIRYNTDGQQDTTFGTAGVIVDDPTGLNVDDLIFCLLLQADGKLVVAGEKYPSGGSIAMAVRYLTTDITIGLIEFTSAEVAPLVYPNPLQNTEHLKYTLGSDEKITIVILDSQGKLVTTFVENEKQAKGDHEVELNLPGNLPNGTYFIQIASEKGKVSIKAIK